MCYSRFSKNSVKNLTFISSRKPIERTLKLIIGNMHFYMYGFPRVAIINYHKIFDVKQ